MSSKIETLPTDGVEVKLSLTSVIYQGGVPESLLENEEFLASDTDFEEDEPDDDEAGPQRLEQVTIASYSEKDGRVTVTYDDSEILEMPNTLTQITYSLDEKTNISIIRSGALKSMITVEEGKRHMGEYRLGPYSIPVSYYGRRVRNTVVDGAGEIELDFTVEMSGSDTSHTKMKISLEKYESSFGK